MKQVVVRGAGAASVIDIDAPEPGPRDIVVEMRACGRPGPSGRPWQVCRAPALLHRGGMLTPNGNYQLSWSYRATRTR